MKSTIPIILTLALYSLKVLAGPACDVQAFKKQYVDLQNALRYDGHKIELNKNGKVKATDEAVDDDNSPGKKAEKALYKNYYAALGKVKKIYDYLKTPDKTTADEKALISNPDVTNFFKAIDESAPSTKLNINIDKLLSSLQSKVKGKDFALNDNDVYLLKKLIIHSQDRICTLDQYVTSKNGASTRVQYLEELKNKPLNLMISQLQKMSGSEDSKFSDQDLAIDEAVKEGINNLHKMAQKCKYQLDVLNLGEPVQSCNYKKFVQSLSVNDNSFRSFEALLHFINANQNAKDGRTSLSWLDQQFKKDSPTSCFVDPNTKALYIKNLPVKNNKVDATQFQCTTGGSKKEDSGEACLKGLSYEFVNGMGHKISPSKQSDIKTLTIKDSANCANISLAFPVLPPLAETDEQKCTKDIKKEWKDGKCIDKQEDVLPTNLDKVCNKEKCLKIEIQDKFIEWHDEGKFCYIGSKGVSQEAAKQTAFCNEAGDLVLPVTEESCKAKKQVLADDKKSCIETPQSCGDKKLPFNPTAKTCEETQESCKSKNKDFDKDKKICIDPQSAPQDEVALRKADCSKKIESDKDEDTGRQLNNWTWNEKTNQCDKRPEKKNPTEQEDNKAPPEEKKEAVYPQKQVPGRFVPVNIPSRQVFILPGMP